MATLTMEWDALRDPTDDDVFTMFGLEATTVANGHTLLWASADKAWDWLRRWGYTPISTEQVSSRKPFRGFVREIKVNWEVPVENRR